MHALYTVNPMTFIVILVAACMAALVTAHHNRSDNTSIHRYCLIFLFILPLPYWLENCQQASQWMMNMTQDTRSDVMSRIMSVFVNKNCAFIAYFINIILLDVYVTYKTSKSEQKIDNCKNEGYMQEHLPI